MTLGLQRGTVRLTRDHTFWAQAFEQEKVAILAQISAYGLDVQHVGSTAIHDIDAKPILDLMLGVPHLADEPLIRPLLESLGYIYRGEQGVSGRVLYVKGDEMSRTHHLHMTLYQSPFWTEHVAFRDHLNANPATAHAYQRLKQTLAAQYPDDREAYTSGKKDFIRRVLDTIESQA